MTERYCKICGTTRNIQKHHIYGAANRKISEREGFVVDLCIEHHTGSHGVHLNKALSLHLKRECQKIYEQDHSREEFIALIGRSYL